MWVVPCKSLISAALVVSFRASPVILSIHVRIGLPLPRLPSSRPSIVLSRVSYNALMCFSLCAPHKATFWFSGCVSDVSFTPIFCSISTSSKLITVRRTWFVHIAIVRSNFRFSQSSLVTKNFFLHLSTEPHEVYMTKLTFSITQPIGPTSR